MRSKLEHEIRDPIHNFIKVTSYERNIIDSKYFQRLRYINQLALAYLLYPGATHKRFEHSLGVMELASRVYDVVTQQENLNDTVREVMPQIKDEDQVRYWRRVIRAAALCHDLGHIPFSHAAEEELLPEGKDHEYFTLKLIAKLEPIWSKAPSINTEHIQKLAVGPEKYKESSFNTWETILSEIITGDAFGVDRMDYLLRDSHHIGVAYGKFDHYRLVDTLRILPKMYESSEEPALGIEEGGIYNAEALLLSRYSMFSQVYTHRVRRIYDIHLTNFMKSYYNGVIAENLEEHQRMTDDKVLNDMTSISEGESGAEPANRIKNRKHFKLLYEIKDSDRELNIKAGGLLFEAAEEEFGENNVRYDEYSDSGSSSEFPVLRRNDEIASSINVSHTINNMPSILKERIFVKPALFDKADEWVENNKDDILGR